MRMYPRPSVILPALFICALLLGIAPAQGDGYTIYFESDRDGDTAIYMFDNGDPVAVTGPNCQHPSVTADGSMLFYTRLEETLWGRFWNVFYVMDDGEEHKLTMNEIYDELMPVISRDGAFAAYTAMRGGNLEIITLPIDRNELIFRVTESDKPDEEPALAIHDEWVYWTGRTGNYSFIFRAPGRGGQAERVTEDTMPWEEHPSVSADGRYLAYAAVTPEEPPPSDEEDLEATIEEEDKNLQTGHKYPWYAEGSTQQPQDEPDESLFEDADGSSDEDTGPAVEGNSDIWVLDMVSGERARLTTDPAWDGHPSISADGEKIVFTSDRDENYDIYIINRDGTGLERLTENDATDDNPTIA